MRFDFALVDAFAERALEGNPCAVVFDADALSEEQMLRITREMKQSETAFLMRSAQADLKARYFTPEKEIPLAGHPTVAALHAALETGWLRSKGDAATYSLELRDGPIQVEVEKGEEGRSLIRMFQRRPILGEIHDPQEVARVSGLAVEDLLPGVLPQSVSTGTLQLMVAVRSQAALRKLRIDPELYRVFRERTGIFSPHYFSLEPIHPDARTFARHVGVAPDVPEDPFTGSATGGMAAYLWHHGLIREPRFIAEQGHWMGRPGRAWVEVLGPKDAMTGVSVAGKAVTVVRGELRI